MEANAKGNKFPFNLFDVRWFSSSIVSSAPANGGSSRTGTGGKTSPPGAAAAAKSEPPLLRSRSHIPGKAEMRKVFDKFDENNDGVIASDELGRFMEKLGFRLSEEELKNLVNLVDHDANGTMDFEEFYSLYTTLTNPDTKQAGASTEQNEKDMERDQEENLREAFNVFDKDQNGFISAAELQAVLKSLGMKEGDSLKKCVNMIQRVDKDGDGQVNFEEFKKMMQSDIFQ